MSGDKAIRFRRYLDTAGWVGAPTMWTAGRIWSLTPCAWPRKLGPSGAYPRTDAVPVRARRRP